MAHDKPKAHMTANPSLSKDVIKCYCFCKGHFKVYSLAQNYSYPGTDARNFSFQPGHSCITVLFTLKRYNHDIQLLHKTYLTSDKEFY